MIEAETVLQSKSSLQLYLCMNTRTLRPVSSWETTGALLGTHITISVKANVQQSSSLPVFSIDRHTCPVEELFTSSHNEIIWWLMAPGSTASSSLSSIKQRDTNRGFWTSAHIWQRWIADRQNHWVTNVHRRCHPGFDVNHRKAPTTKKNHNIFSKRGRTLCFQFGQVPT